MQFSESWLRSFVNPSLTSEELSHLLTMAGLEVEEMHPVAPFFDKVVVAQVLSKEKHPDADRLNLLKIDAGQGEPLSIVCGAGNVTVGMKAPCALVGARLPGIEIRQAKVRGVASSGMMCSAKELGLSEESSGLLELPVDARVGQDIREYLNLDDNLFTLKLTPNRSDCLSVYGIAREVSALTGTTLKSEPAPSIDLADSRKLTVQIHDAVSCPRYTGRIISGLNAKAETPRWMVSRLERCGLRSISAIVDVTNYVLLELGQPLHAFDLDKLDGGIAVRFAYEGEQIRLLNEQTVELQSDLLVIADNSKPVALAGIMGGADSAVDDSTSSIFLESAFFAPKVILGKSRRLGFTSDSSYRFERGVDYTATAYALDRATQLVLEICGGKAGEVSEATGVLPVRHAVKLRPARVQRVLGVALSSEKISKILASLGMQYRLEGSDFLVIPPSYRFDVAIEEDLIEEIARVHGYEQIPPLQAEARLMLLPQSEALRPLAKLRQAMALRDYQETINYSFVEAEWELELCGNEKPLVVLNPISSQMSVMRSSLLGGLLSSLRTNIARKQPRVRLFEVGGCFMRQQGGFVQHDRLAGVAYGTALPEQWGEANRAVDFFDIKGDIEAMFGIMPLRFEVERHPAAHPGRVSRVFMGERPVGWLGELHPRWQQKYDLLQTVQWFELELDVLMSMHAPKAGEFSRFPPVRRDIAVVVDEQMTVQTLLDSMRHAGASFVSEIALFDMYRGKGVDSGKKSLAFRVLLQDTQKTLTEAEIDQSVACLVKALQNQGAQLRV